MNKKQAGIIVTLLALIVCAGILAARVNGPLDVTNDSYDAGSVFNWGAKDKSSQTDYFAATRVERLTMDNQTLAAWKQVMDEKDVSQEERDTAARQYTLKTNQMDFEGRIEAALKGKGFEEVICLIEADNSKARVIVKAKELTSQQRKQIQDVVASVSKITKVEIETKQ